MGFEFKTEEQRNPTQQQPNPELTKIEELENKIKLYEQFLNDNGYGVLFDMYVDVINGKVSQEDYNNFQGSVEYEEITE
jgi:hypothetical protein